MSLKNVTAAVASMALFCLSGFAGSIPYGNPGAINPVVPVFTATTTGDVIAYFYGSTASYDSEVGLSVNGAAPTTFGLMNHASSHGDWINLGSVAAGDKLVLVLNVLTTSSMWYSNQILNADLKNHAFFSSFAGDAQIPAGTYVGFEDLPAGSPWRDWDYNDNEVVLSNVTAVAHVPEPASMALMGAGLVGLGLLLRRHRRHRA